MRSVALRSGVTRLTDAAVAAAGLALFSPIIAAVALLVRVCDGPPVLFRARRAGLNGRAFVMYKFRTMVDAGTGTGGPITGRQDRRITALGHWLRATRLDELPQMFNVLRGDMALVGPRPEDPELLRGCPPGVTKLLQYRPGITSPASIRYRSEATANPSGSVSFYRETLLPEKAKIDLAYLETRSAFSDMAILIRSITAVLSDILRAHQQPEPRARE